VSVLQRRQMFAQIFALINSLMMIIADHRALIVSCRQTRLDLRAEMVLVCANKDLTFAAEPVSTNQRTIIIADIVEPPAIPQTTKIVPMGYACKLHIYASFTL
jgi:hypothetical protein